MRRWRAILILGTFLLGMLVIASAVTSPSRQKRGLAVVGTLIAAGPLALVRFASISEKKGNRRSLLTIQERIRRGLCFRCGYDLRGNVSGNCPECGARVNRMYGGWTA